MDTVVHLSYKANTLSCSAKCLRKLQRRSIETQIYLHGMDNRSRNIAHRHRTRSLEHFQNIYCEDFFNFYLMAEIHLIVQALKTTKGYFLHISKYIVINKN